MTALPAAFAAATQRRPLSPVRFVLFVLSVVMCTIFWLAVLGGGKPVDAVNWYVFDYGFDNYIWSPAFAQLTIPLRSLPFDLFVPVVRAVELMCLVALAPFGAFVAILLPPVAAEVNSGNINMVLTLCVVLGLRWPAMWTVPLLTKPSMGLGLIWFLVRKEWRSFAIAVVPAAVIAAVSFAIDPQSWFAWIKMLTGFGDIPGWPFPIPIWPRIPIALVLVVWGARTNRPWTVMAATFIAWPRLYFQSLAILVGLIPLLGLQTWMRRNGTTWLDVIPAWLSRDRRLTAREGTETQAPATTG